MKKAIPAGKNPLWEAFTKRKVSPCRLYIKKQLEEVLKGTGGKNIGLITKVAAKQFSGLPLQINAVYTQTRITLGGANARAQNVDLGTAWHYSAANTLNVGYTFSKYEGARWNQFSLGNVYAFSKRTQVYVQGTYQRASGDAQSAAINGVGVAAQRNQLVVSTGVHHSF